MKPCPFCGNTKPRVHKFHDRSFVVCCDKCGCEAPHDSVSGDGAKRIWNRRRYPVSDLEETV